MSTRTAELTRSNTALACEIAERESAEAKVRRLRDDLAQANRLSILGQIAAGVAHEINQPVAAIRTYAEAARRLRALIVPMRAGNAPKRAECAPATHLDARHGGC